MRQIARQASRVRVATKYYRELIPLTLFWLVMVIYNPFMQLHTPPVGFFQRTVYHNKDTVMQVLSGIGRALFTVLSMFWEILWPLILGLTLSGIVQVMVLHWTLARTLGCEVARKDDAIFFGDDGKPLAYWGAAALFRCLKKKTGIDGKRVSAHNCRRYMATTQLADGRSPLDVQRQMGHRNLTMTNKYASLTVQHLKKSHE